MNRRTILTLILLIGIATGIMLGVALSTRGQVQPEAGGGGGAVWTARRVTVRIYTSEAWRPLVLQSVADLNAIMPRRGPKLRPRLMGEHSCEWVRKQRYRQPTITICSVPPPSGFWGSTALTPHHHTVKREMGRVKLIGHPGHDDRSLEWHQNTACHELMHAISWVNDNYGSEPESCVQGELPHPGAWDRAYLQKVYRKHGR